MSFLNFGRATLAQIAFYIKMWVLLLISYTMFAINIAILIILFVMMQLWRWEHSGRVCSGDYLDHEPTEEDKKTYLIEEGFFLHPLKSTTKYPQAVICHSVIRALGMALLLTEVLLQPTQIS